MMLKRLSKPVLVLGGVMMATGLILMMPSWLNNMRFATSRGDVIEAFWRPLDDGRVELAICYRYRIAPGHLPDYPRGAYALGYQRCDLFANPVEDLVFSDAELAQSELMRIRSNAQPAYQVYYDPADPITTARAQNQTALMVEALGMALMLAPLLYWAVAALFLAIGGIRMNRQR